MAQGISPVARVRRSVGWRLRGRTELRERYAAIRDSGLFDAAYYRAQNPDVAAARLDPLAHYVEHGSAEGRQAAADLRPGFEESLFDPLVPLLPPEDMRATLEPFEEIGNAFLDHFLELGGLVPTDAVLDVGSGLGRMAIPLTRYLRPPGRYEGFDVLTPQVEWCRRRITPLHPHFRFQSVDVYNGEYNPFDPSAAASFRFPYADASFDFVVLASVFTHLLRDDMEHYLREVRRVLRPGGRMLATFFLRDEERPISPDARFTLATRLDDVTSVDDPEHPEAVVAYEERHVRALLDEDGFELAGLYPGSWTGFDEEPESYQDIVVARVPA
jgi:SAM-dependent methyltransferase